MTGNIPANTKKSLGSNLFEISGLVLLVWSLCISGVRAQDTFLDTFSSESYSNNDGTQDFSGNWTESGENNDPGGGRIEIRDDQLRFRNIDERSISRTLDLSRATAAVLTLDYVQEDGDELLLVELFNGSSWNRVASLEGEGTLSYTLTSAERSASSAIRFSSDSGNWSNGDEIFIDNVLFTATLEPPNQPPVLTVAGDQLYCPGDTTPVVESISITDPDDTTAPLVSIEISTGYVPGEDVLTLNGSHPSLTDAWDVENGILSLTGPALLTEFEDAVREVVYSSSAPNPTGTRVFTITVGDPGLSDSGNTVITIDPDSCGPCEAGSSAPTLNPDVPTNFCSGDILLSLNSYTDSAPPAGPELIWSINPNPLIEEGHLTQTQVDNPTPGSYYGFFFDSVNNCASPTLNLTLALNETPSITSTTSADSCGPASLVLSATGEIPNSSTAPDILWYTSETANTPVFNGPSYTTPELSGTTSYWVAATANGCASSPRVEVVARIAPVVSAGTATNASACNDPDNGPATLDLDDQIEAADPGDWTFVDGPAAVSGHEDGVV